MPREGSLNREHEPRFGSARWDAGSGDRLAANPQRLPFFNAERRDFQKCGGFDQSHDGGKRIVATPMFNDDFVARYGDSTL